MTRPCRVLVLGAGPAGLGAAYQLTRLNRARVMVIERSQQVGGLAGSFELAGLRVDYGSHRLHPACAPAILADLRRMLGDDLLDRPRHGRIRLRGRWIHFPLKPVDLLRALPFSFACGVAGDLLRKAQPFHRNGGADDSFATGLQRGLGTTICRDFYFPYARKIWGLDPQELAPTQARRRVRAGTLGKLFRKVLAAVPGFQPAAAGRFHYPRRGYGQISERYYEAARDQGAEFLFQASVEAIHVSAGKIAAVEYRTGGQRQSAHPDYVWSTIPVTRLVQMLQPQPPEAVAASYSLRYRSMILVYLVLAQRRFSEFDAHYFPEPDIAITRMSEPRNYSTVEEPADRTVLCAELPCQKGDPYWNLADESLSRLVQEALARVGLPLTAPVLQVHTRRLAEAYPIYQRGYERSFSQIDDTLKGIRRLLSFGRQGLFAHDNTHHALAMAYAAVDCLDANGCFDQSKWMHYRERFEAHVVED